MTARVVEVDDLGVRYDGRQEPALTGVSLVVGAGEVVGLVGHVGSGRSTLLRCLNGIVPSLERATITGRISVDGRDPASTPVAAMAAHVAIVLDDPESRMSRFSVEEEVAFGLECLGTPFAEMRRRVPAALASVGLGDVARREPLTLSGGELQRLAVACATAVEPALLLLDDPTAHLDAVSARAVFRLAAAHARRSGAAVIVASEEVDLLAEHVDRVIAFERGRLVADGAPGVVFAEGARTGRWPVPSVTAACALSAPEAPSLPATVEEALAAGIDVAAVELGDRRAVPDRSGASSSGGPAIELVAVAFRYPDAAEEAICDVSIAVAPGEVLALVGESGSGKSTLARLAAGLLPPAAGNVAVGGVHLASIARRELAGRVGLVFQNPNHQLLVATVADELALGPRNLGLPSDEVDRRVKEIARALDLEAVLGVHPYRLGMADRKRLTVGAVMAMRTPVLVLDEPTSGQGEAERALIAGLVAGAAAGGTAVLLVTHDLAFADLVADRVAVLRAGRVVTAGSTRAVLADPDRLARAGLEAPPLHRLRAALRERATGAEGLGATP